MPKNTSSIFPPVSGMLSKWSAQSPNEVPYATPSLGEDGSYLDITDAVKRGEGFLYKKDEHKDNRFFRDNNTGATYLVYPWAKNVSPGNKYSEISYSQLRKEMPKSDYIGGTPEETRMEVMKRLAGLSNLIYERSSANEINPNIIVGRVGKEGLLDRLVQRYNESSPTEQKEFFSQARWEEPIDGFDTMGGDDIADELETGKFTLLDPNATWKRGEGRKNEHGRTVYPVMPDNLASAIEILSAALKYRQDKVKELYNPDSADLDTWTNAAYNLGIWHPYLKNRPDYIRKNYSVPDYYSKYNLEYTYGGRMTKLASIASRLQETGYYRDGGKIHIKPENRGKFTALKERTGHSATWFKQHGTPAQKKMATFALNARHWKHNDGGFLMLPPK